MSHFFMPFRRTTCFQATLLVLFVCGGITLYGQDTNTPPSDASAAAPSGSLVSNGDFSTATNDPGWPDNWGKATGISWEIENGKHFLRLVAQKPDQHLMAYREIVIPPEVKGLVITIRYRTAGVTPGSQPWYDARAIFHFLNDSRKTLPPDPRAMVFSTDASDWTVATEQCVVPDGATKLVLMPSLFKVQGGTLDLAEISVTPANP